MKLSEVSFRRMRKAHRLIGQAGPEKSRLSDPAFGPPRKNQVRGQAGSVPAVLKLEIHAPLLRSMERLSSVHTQSPVGFQFSSKSRPGALVVTIP
ncbi:MAG: hypothetical protein H7251_13890 [Acetobacteraceae bacterium]|nr:hypothetical protein [Acetobacteraceae bacterium]